MDDRQRTFLKYVSLVMAAAWTGWWIYGDFVAQPEGAGHALVNGDKFFESRDYERALVEYEKALARSPQAPYLVRAKARALTRLGRYQEALALFETASELQPHFAGNYAARGMLYDRTGQYELAVADYQRALRLDEVIGESAGALALLDHADRQPPTTLKERLVFLQNELAKPPEDRVLPGGRIDSVPRG